jgi:uncharacterized protein (TIGR04168 family)
MLGKGGTKLGMVNTHDCQEQEIKIAVVGDIHDQWNDRDRAALSHLGVDLVLFVGDFGNESVSVVREIAQLDLPKAVVFGNHDAWYTATEWGRKKCPYDRDREDWVQQQLDLVADCHASDRPLNFPELGVSVVGTRPFSWGGPEWKYADFYRQWFGLNSFEESTQRMVKAAEAAESDTIIFLGHNGPTGLGDRPEDPCGRDWRPLGGDFGDPDFAEAIARTRDLGKTIPLVTFGHMHHRLRHTQERLRRSIHVDADRTVYVNAACVPRIVPAEMGDRHNFSLVTLQNGQVSDVSLVWVDPDFKLVLETKLYDRRVFERSNVPLSEAAS